jgi:hypothetical protein
MPRTAQPDRYVPLDTSPQAHQMQAESLRRMGGKARSAIMFRLNQLARDVALAGIRSRHPAYTDEQVRLAFFRLKLGDETTRRVWPDRDLVDP